MTRNYRVFTGTQLINNFDINQVDGHTVYDYQLFAFDSDAQHSEVYGPFVNCREASDWCNDSNKLFRELKKEVISIIDEIHFKRLDEILI